MTPEEADDMARRFKNFKQAFGEAVRAAIEEEREACAKVADWWYPSINDEGDLRQLGCPVATTVNICRQGIGVAIRGRSTSAASPDATTAPPTEPLL